MAISNLPTLESNTMSSRFTSLSFKITSAQAAVVVNLAGRVLINEVFFPDANGYITIDRIDEVTTPVLESIFFGDITITITERNASGGTVSTKTVTGGLTLAKPRPLDDSLSSENFWLYNACTVAPWRRTFKNGGEYLHAYIYIYDAQVKVLLWQNNAKRWVTVTVEGRTVDTRYRRFDVSYAVILQKLTDNHITLGADDYIIGWEVDMGGRGAKFHLVQDTPQLCGFLFRNGFGMLEYFWCQGVEQSELQTERKEFEVAGSRQYYKQVSERQRTVHSGPIPAAMIPLWHDFMESREIFRIGENVNGVNILQRIYVTGDKSEWSTDYQEITRCEFSYKLAERMPSQYITDVAKAAFTFSES